MSKSGFSRRVFGAFVIMGTVLAAACKQQDASANTGATSTASLANSANPGQLTLTPASAPRMPNGDTLTDSALIAHADAGRLMGRDSGAMWMIVISDFQCPYCKTWHDSTIAALKRDYIDNGKVRMAYLNLPLPQHPHARAEAQAGLCAGAQKRFWPYAAGLFARQEPIATLANVEPLLDSLARANALDMTEFTRCRKSKAINALVESDIQQSSRSGVRSTPSFLIGDFLVEGAAPYANFRRAIDTALVVARNKSVNQSANQSVGKR